MDATFRRALLPEPRYECLRRALQPLTLGHLAILHALRSPFLTGAEVQEGDLVLAVAVCSRSYRAALRMLRRNLTTAAYLWLWGLRVGRKCDIMRELLTFLHYLREGRQRPPVSAPTNSGTRALASPQEWRLIEELTRRGMSWQQAMNTPVTVAECLWTVRKEDEGRLQLAQVDLLSRLWQRAHQ